MNGFKLRENLFITPRKIIKFRSIIKVSTRWTVAGEKILHIFISMLKKLTRCYYWKQHGWRGKKSFKRQRRDQTVKAVHGDGNWWKKKLRTNWGYLRWKLEYEKLEIWNNIWSMLGNLLKQTCGFCRRVCISAHS